MTKQLLPQPVEALLSALITSGTETSTTEAAPSTRTNEETELSSCLADPESESTQTAENALVLCSAQWKRGLLEQEVSECFGLFSCLC